MDNTIPSIFQSSAEKYRDRIAFNYFDPVRKLTQIEQAPSKLSNGVDGLWKAMTYEEFFLLSNNIASFLLSNGLNKGDRIAIVSENRPEWCASYMAILMCGGIAVPIDMQLGSDEIRNLLIDSETEIVFYSSKTEANVLKAVEGTEIKGINFDRYQFTPPKSPPCQGGAVGGDDIASIIYTSGTTGKPKGVMLTHENFCSDAESVIQAKVVTHDDNVLSILPLHHTYPFMCTFIVPVFIGATVTFAPGLKAVELISTIKDKDITIVVSVPRLLEMIRNGIVSKIKEKKIVSGIVLWMMKLCGMMRMKLGLNIGKIVFKSIHKNFGRLKFFASGGARLEPSIMKDLEAFGFTVLEGYGLTETSPVITFNPPEKRKPGSAGKPLPCVEIKIS
ncbi:MAG: AMP-binding protein, partial [Nitrospiraceae bacterium]|nr:AMP-binding protein [Nitrospirota bacterium]MDA8338149.1 AMP-binding protein [Nitrospiraceae bacterium]